MGSGSNKTHESFTVTPTLDPPVESVPDEEITGKASWDAIEALQDLHSSSFAMTAEEAVSEHDAFTQHVAAAQQALDQLTGVLGPDHPLIASQQAALDLAAGYWLGAVETEGLAELAAQAGFEHPTLVGHGALQSWLHPATDPAAKAAIELKASERYDLLAAGQTINGQTLATLQAAEAKLGIAPLSSGAVGEWPTWSATPADIVATQAALAQALGDMPKGPAPSTAQLAAVLEQENKLATATCPELGDGLDLAVAAARHNVSAATAKIYALPELKEMVAQQLEANAAAGLAPPAAGRVLNLDEAIQLARASTPQTERDALLATYTKRSAELAQLQAAWETYSSHKPGKFADPVLPGLAEPGAVTTVAGFAKAAGVVHELSPQIAKDWGQSVLTPSTAVDPYHYPKDLSTEFRSWAKNQSLGDLRTVATELGLEHASKATRPQVQNWIAAHWDHNLDGKAIASKIAAPKPTAPVKPAGIAAPVKPAAAAVSSPPAAPASVAGSAGTKASSGSWSDKHQALVGALKHHAASLDGIPERVPAGNVAAWSFTPAPSTPSMGGAHTKSVHLAPDGSKWMFKPDKSAGGARAHAEAAASSVFAKVGVPAVPVYAHTIGTKTGSIQPLMTGTSNISTNPGSWSQADVDAMVRYHVAAWAVGDHDGKPDNLLRTPGGGIVPVDAGQAFKFFGTDSLATSYHPNGSYGASQPVFHLAYKAAANGQLAPGVKIRPEAALGVIKSFEAVSDGDYRGLLNSTAVEGAKHSGTHWAGPMRQRAAKATGKTTSAVSAGEVASQFLDYALERKQNLRSSFASFFAGLGVAGADKLNKVT